MMTTEINDDRVLDARDMAEEIAAARNGDKPAQPRTFEDVLREWMDACEAENRATPSDLAIVAYVSPLIIRLNSLGNRLISEASIIGARMMVDTVKEMK